MITKGIVRSISLDCNRCIVRLPLFETASSTAPVEIEALLSITPGMYNNLEEDDVVFVAFEENALEKPVVIGKLYIGSDDEYTTNGGVGILSDLIVRANGTLPAATTNFVFDPNEATNYKNLDTPKKIADYIKWLETHAKNLVRQLDAQFRCFKEWTQWQFKPENVEIDDGDIDTGLNVVEPFLYQTEGCACEVCANCTKDARRYPELAIKDYSEL